MNYSNRNPYKHMVLWCIPIWSGINFKHMCSYVEGSWKSACQVSLISGRHLPCVCQQRLKAAYQQSARQWVHYCYLSQIFQLSHSNVMIIINRRWWIRSSLEVIGRSNINIIMAQLSHDNYIYGIWLANWTAATNNKFWLFTLKIQL